MAGDGSRAVEGAGEVGVQHRAPLVVGYVPDRLAALSTDHAGIVDEDVDAAKLAHGCLDQLAHLLRVGDVRRLGERPGAYGPDLVGDALQRLRAAAREDYVAAGAGEGQGHLPAEAGAAPGDDGNGTIEAERLQYGLDHAGMIMPEGATVVVPTIPSLLDTHASR